VNELVSSAQNLSTEKKLNQILLTVLRLNLICQFSANVKQSEANSVRVLRGSNLPGLSANTKNSPRRYLIFRSVILWWRRNLRLILVADCCLVPWYRAKLLMSSLLCSWAPTSCSSIGRNPPNSPAKSLTNASMRSILSKPVLVQLKCELWVIALGKISK